VKRPVVVRDGYNFAFRLNQRIRPGSRMLGSPAWAAVEYLRVLRRIDAPRPSYSCRCYFKDGRVGQSRLTAGFLESGFVDVDFVADGLARRGKFTAAESDARAEAARLVSAEATRVERLRPPVGSEAAPVERLRLAGSILHREVDRLPPEQAERLSGIVGALVDLCAEVARG